MNDGQISVIEEGRSSKKAVTFMCHNKAVSRRRFLRDSLCFCCGIGVLGGALGPGAVLAGRPGSLLNSLFGQDKAYAADRGGTGRQSGADMFEKDFTPAYLELHHSGELARRADKLWQMMSPCRLCPRECRADRHQGRTGVCRSPGTQLLISSAMPHFGEERPLVGRGGSGTVFLAHCGLRCVFCQNYEISHLGRGHVREVEEMARMLLRLQQLGCHNINFVTPTHYSAAILKALDLAAGRGLRLPVVYNTCGWERLEVLALLDGVVDIYLPDFKFWDGDVAAELAAGARTYPEVTRKALLEMHRQVGVAKPNRHGVMERGLMIRHLVMPNRVAGSAEFLEWLAENLPQDTYVNIMAQYSPHYRALDLPKISRRTTGPEYREVVEKARDLGLTNLDVQGGRWLLR